MVSLSVDGLISGLDTTTIVKQLLDIERIPQQRLTAKRDTVNKVADLYRQLNTRFQAVEDAAEGLSSSADWGLATVSSSHAAIASATVTSGAPASAIAFRVTSLAASHVVVSSGTVADPATAGVFSAGFSVGGTAITDVGTGSLTDVAAAINSASSTVQASVVRTGADAYRLQLSSRATGADSTFTVTGTGLEALGTVNQIVTQGADASIEIGSTNPYVVTSSSNTLTDVISGVTLSLKSADPATTVSVEVTSDATGLADRIQTMVNTVNDATGLVRSNAKYDVTTKKAGAFLSDQIAGRLGSSLISAVTSGVTGSTLSPSAAGISVSRDGVLSFDKAKFLAAYAADPDAVQTTFMANGTGTTDDGIAERLRVVTASATDIATGQITSAVQSRESTARSLADQIAGWDNRLALKERTLKRQFSALETALGQAKSQSAWLSSQIASLPQY